MTHYHILIVMFWGFIAINFIDTVGAVASRRLNFNYGYLSIFSFATYMGVVYFLTPAYSLPTALFANIILGVYDATIGFWLSIILGANTGYSEEKMKAMLGKQTITIMLAVSLLFGMIGYGLSTFSNA